MRRKVGKMSKVLDEINFFGSMDRKGKTKDGAITSEYPAFYFNVQLDDLKEETERQERQIELGLVPPSELPYVKAEVARNKDRMNEIEQSYPKLSDKEKDAVYATYKDLGEKISDSMFTRTDMKKGLVDAHEEARRMSEPIIPIKGQEKFFHNMGITAKQGKVSRNDAAKAYKIMGRFLGENTVIERLRKDRNTGTFNLERSLQELLDK